MKKAHIHFLGIFLTSLTTWTMPDFTQPQQVWLTVFAHGIMSIKPHLSFSNFARFMTDDVQNTVYSTTVELMRQDPLFFQNQPMQEIGLRPIDLTRIEKGYSCGAMAMVFEEMTAFANATHDIPSTRNYYYTYGWSGLLSPKRRYIDAKLLYSELAKEVARLQAQGINPKIRLVGYSHGGNVLLNLGKIHQTEPSLGSFVVDQLILLGTPIQHETDYLINDSLFTRVYHIYSRDDRVQKLDFFSFNRFFSGRTFKPRSGFALPDKLVQIQLKCSRPLRTKKVTVRTSSSSQTNIQTTRRLKNLRNASPGHCELWFFSWTPANYRNHFPLNPLPSASLIPLIVTHADKLKKNNILLDVRPTHEVIIVKNKDTHQVMETLRFLSKNEFDNLTSKVLAYKPDNYSLHQYNDTIQNAFHRAKRLRRHERIAHKHARKTRLHSQAQKPLVTQS